MAKCKYCGKSAGLFSKAHQECEEFAQETIKYFKDLAAHAFVHGGDLCELKMALRKAAAEACLEDQEREQTALQAIAKGIENALEDGVVTKEEENNLILLKEAFSLRDASLYALPAWDKLVKSRVLADILEGRTPKRFHAGGLTIVLQPHETVIWAFPNVAFFEMRTRRAFVGGSAGISVRVMKGVYLRSSAFRGHPVETAENVHVDTGAFVITNKHLFFQGASGVVKMPAKKLVTIDPLF